MLSSNTPVRKGGRRRSFRISARPRGLCATLLWREVLIRKLPLNITDFSKRIGVPRTTVLCVFKQLDDYKNFPPSKAKGREGRVGSRKTKEKETVIYVLNYCV